MGSASEESHAEPGQIESLSAEELDLLVLELMDYADFLIKTKAYWLPRAILPRGYDASALAQEAIVRVLDGRRRPWDPSKEPTLTAYLKSVIKSIFSSELMPAAKAQPREVTTHDEEGRDAVAEARSEDPAPDALAAVSEMKDRLLARFDVEEDQLVLLCLFDGVTAPGDIERETGIARTQIYRIKQKISRRLRE